MSILETSVSPEPTATQGANRVRNILAMAFQQIEMALLQVRQVTERHGPNEIATALASDKEEVVAIYRSLKTLVEKHKPDTQIKDLPLS